MKRYSPRSILQLTLLGFTVVTLPLVAALVSAFISVDGLARQSRLAVFNAPHAMKSSQQLVDEITEMERYARQYQVLQDPSVWKLYDAEHREFGLVVQDLQQINLGELQMEQLDRLISAEQQLFTRLSETKGTKKASEALQTFRELSALARSLLEESSLLIRREADDIQRRAAESQVLLFWQAMALIPAALLLAIIFSILITRPLHQFDRSIRRLGSGDFAAPVEVKGPRDLEELGQRLDWLRVRLVELETQKVSVLRHISHELKTPLTALREGAELLSEGVLGRLNPEQKEVAGILRENSLKLQKRIEDLLSFSVARTPTRNEVHGQIPLRVLVMQVILDHKLAIKSKGLELRSHLAECTAVGDPEQIRMIFDNLISNAIKYSPDGGVIGVRLVAHDANAVLDVRDHGPGIHPQEKGRIFEAFYQGNAIDKGHVKGTGLGLAIAQEFARLHQGAIEIIDTTEGAFFRLTLPLGHQA